METPTTITTKVVNAPADHPDSSSSSINPVPSLLAVESDSELSEPDEEIELLIAAHEDSSSSKVAESNQNPTSLVDGSDDDDLSQSEVSTRSNKRLYQPDSDSESDVVHAKKPRLAKQSGRDSRRGSFPSAPSCLSMIHVTDNY